MKKIAFVAACSVAGSALSYVDAQISIALLSFVVGYVLTTRYMLYRRYNRKTIAAQKKE